ncbi:hypothetical protein D3C71_1975890 [compost metagenome]
MPRVCANGTSSGLFSSVAGVVRLYAPAVVAAVTEIFASAAALLGCSKTPKVSLCTFNVYS